MILLNDNFQLTFFFNLFNSVKGNVIIIITLILVNETLVIPTYIDIDLIKYIKIVIILFHNPIKLKTSLNFLFYSI